MDFGIVVDVETTGLDPEKDTIIELGMIEFGISDGMPPVILNMYGALQDPGCPLSDDIAKLTGLTDRALKGQEVNWSYVAQMWSRAQIIVAHNAAFDRSFLTKVPQLKSLGGHWACSVRHIDWHRKGFESRKLNYLAADHGFINPFAHRALFDCATTFRLVEPHLRELVQRSYEPEIKIKAVGSPFETKDILKANHYRWDGDQRVWHKTVLKDQLEGERQFLSEKVYQGAPRHVEEVSWFNAPQSTYETQTD